MATVFCQNCGAQVDSSSAFCTNCGAKMIPATQDVQQSFPQPAAPQYSQPAPGPQYPPQGAPGPQYPPQGAPVPGQPGMPVPNQAYPGVKPPKKKNTGCIIAAVIVGVLLIIVIPVCAILAAIAIPAVVGISNSANESSYASDAATVDNACKTYYAGIVSGTINYDDDYYSLMYSYDSLPSKGASNSLRKEMALECTIGGALDYNGTYSVLSDKLSNMGADSNGNIYYIYDSMHSDDIVKTSLSTYTTFSELGYD